MTDFQPGNSGRRYRVRVIGDVVRIAVYSAQHRELVRESVRFDWRHASTLGLALVQAATRSEAGRGSGRSAAEPSREGRSYAAAALGDGRVRLHMFGAGTDHRELAGESFAHLAALNLGMALIRGAGAAQACAALEPAA